MSEQLRERCSAFFDNADADGSGCLNKFELCKVVRSAGCEKSTAEVASWFEDIDDNDDNKVTKPEFLDALAKIPQKDVKEADLRAAFRKFDTDQSGSVTVDELKAALEQIGEDPAMAELQCDANDDGKVSFEEFLNAWRDQN